MAPPGQYVDELSFRNLTDIEECKGEIELRMKGLEKCLAPLIEGVIQRHETTKVLFHELIQEYRTLLIRLSATPNDKEMPPGCLFPIIYSNVFEDSSVEDDHDAIEIFGVWSVYNAKDYRDAGLFGIVTDEEFEKLKSLTNMFILGSDNLAKLGIKCVRDWKEGADIQPHHVSRVFKSAKQSPIDERRL